MSISTIRRQVKNVAFKFSDAQIKVREATSNDPWGPSTKQMAEIAYLTHNPLSFIEIMTMIWKRLNDSGKNWRHVYKSLVVLEFVLKCGHEKVVQQCRENVYTIETLKDFQYVDGARDEGMSIRTLSETITRLLADRERLTNERAKFVLTREKYREKNSMSVGAESRTRLVPESATTYPDYENRSSSPPVASDKEDDIQLQIALAMSREEAEKADELRRSDAVRLQMALEQSEAAVKRSPVRPVSSLDDLLSLDVGENRPSSSAQVIGSPWSVVSWPTTVTAADAGSANWDPFGAPPTSNHFDVFGIDNPAPIASTASDAPFDIFGGDVLTPTNSLPIPTTSSSTATATNNLTGSQRIAENFLGAHNHLVNLDNLMGGAKCI